MKSYELTYLILSELSEEKIKSLEEKINSLIQEEGGILGEINSPTKRKLAYSINKKDEAYLANLNFQIKPGGLNILEKKLRAEGEILRYLILTKRALKEEVKPKLSKVFPRKTLEGKPKVELKEIEKKLEEILGE